MTLSVQSSGNFIPSQMSAKSGWSRSAASCGSALNTSVLRLSCPGNFPFLRDLMAAMISSFPGGSVLTSRSVSASCISASVGGGGGLFRTSLKCSVPRASCSASVVISRPCLSMIRASVPLLYLPHTSLVIL